MKKLFLKLKNSWHCYKDSHNYEFKETECGRFFVWKSKYANGAPEVTFQFNRKDEKTLSHEDYCNQLEENRKAGYCFEVGRTSYEYYLNREKEIQKTLSNNLKFLGPNGEKPPHVQLYEGTPEDNAKKSYEKSNYPFCWGYIIDINDYGQLYIVDMIKNSDLFYNKKGEQIIYDRAFFDSIGHNTSKAAKILKDIKTFLESRPEKGVMSIYEEIKNKTDDVFLTKKLCSLKLEFYFADNAKRMEKEIKALLPKDKKKINKGIHYKIEFNTNHFETDYSVFSHIK